LEPESQDLGNQTHVEESDTSFHSPSLKNSCNSSFSASFESLPDEIGIGNEVKLLSFTEKLQNGMQAFMQHNNESGQVDIANATRPCRQSIGMKKTHERPLNICGKVGTGQSSHISKSTC